MCVDACGSSRILWWGRCSNHHLYVMGTLGWPSGYRTESMLSTSTFQVLSRGIPKSRSKHHRRISAPFYTQLLTVWTCFLDPNHPGLAQEPNAIHYGVPRRFAVSTHHVPQSGRLKLDHYITHRFKGVEGVGRQATGGMYLLNMLLIGGS